MESPRKHTSLIRQQLANSGNKERRKAFQKELIENYINWLKADGSKIIMNNEDGRYTAFYDEHPEIVVQGNSKEDVEERLDRAVAAILINLAPRN